MEEQTKEKQTAEEQKQQDITTLYALRAGLSVIAEIYDDVSQAKKNVNGFESAIKRNENVISIYKKKQKEELSIKEKREKEFSQSKGVAYNNMKIQKKSVNELKNKLDYTFALKKNVQRALLYVLGCFVAFWVVAFIAMIFIDDGDIASGLAMPFFIGFTISCILACVLQSKRKKEGVDIKITSEKLLKEQNILNELEEKHQRLVASKDETLSKILDEYNAAIAQYQDMINDKQNEIEQTHSLIDKENDKLKEVLSYASAAHKALREEFSSFLDERDWGNTDLLIFYFETGRALDMRDALMQVDNERRNEKLVHATSYASSVVSDSMRRGLGELQAGVTRQLGSLDNRIIRLTDNVSDMTRQSSEQSYMLQSNLRQIATAGMTQAALLNKIGVSSDRMARSMEEMRDLAERTYKNEKVRENWQF